MNSLDIFQFLLYPLLAYFGYTLGFIDGKDKGNIEGRKAVRKQFEQAGR